MSLNKPPYRIKYLSNQNIIEIVSEFVNQKSKDIQLPIQIEKIVENNGLSIVAVRDLKSDFGIDSYLTEKAKLIMIDEYQFLNCLQRSNFTIAHEFSHSILHKEFLLDKTFSSIDEYSNYVHSFSVEEERSFQKQANIGAGYLLMPKASFCNDVNLWLENYNNDDTKIGVSELVTFVSLLSSKYSVSKQAIRYQFQNEFPKIFELINNLVSTD
jgi:Zn-dependent peptidase ImmA (M78 family)